MASIVMDTFCEFYKNIFREDFFLIFMRGKIYCLMFIGGVSLVMSPSDFWA